MGPVIGTLGGRFRPTRGGSWSKDLELESNKVYVNGETFTIERSSLFLCRTDVVSFSSSGT